jgi:hypothetical protein
MVLFFFLSFLSRRTAFLSVTSSFYQSSTLERLKAAALKQVDSKIGGRVVKPPPAEPAPADREYSEPSDHEFHDALEKEDFHAFDTMVVDDEVTNLSLTPLLLAYCVDKGRIRLVAFRKCMRL